MRYNYTGHERARHAKLDGVLETALYTDDMARARAFYEGVLELKPIFEDKRLCAYGIAERSVLLIFHRGRATETVMLPNGGSIPGHDGAGPLHIAFAIAKDSAAMGGATEVARCRRRRPLIGRAADAASISETRTGTCWS